jgi:hypothetical protein
VSEDEPHKLVPVVTPYRMPAGTAEKRIREIAKEAGSVIVGAHARKRMLEREIDDVDVLRTLRSGHINGEPEPAEPGEWKCKMVKQVKGAREAGVVVIILRSKRLFVKTVEWEDLR